jgi:hypothetical protein
MKRLAITAALLAASCFAGASFVRAADLPAESTSLAIARQGDDSVQLAGWRGYYYGPRYGYVGVGRPYNYGYRMYARPYAYGPNFGPYARPYYRPYYAYRPYVYSYGYSPYYYGPNYWRPYVYNYGPAYGGFYYSF